MTNISNKILNYSHYIFFLLLLITGLFLYKDFGYNIDETFQRKSGLYWLKYVSDFFNFDEFSNLVQQKLNTADDFTNPWSNKYGVIFDVPAAYLEIILKINNPLKIYEFRHLLNFLYFYLGVIFLYKLLINRFNNKFYSLFGCILFILTPRIFGDSFQNNKDIIFITFFIISIFYLFKTVEKNSIKNFIFLSLFSAIATSTRLFGLVLPISIIFISILAVLSNKTEIKNLKFLLIYFSFYFLFLIIHWPLLWENAFTNLHEYLNNLKIYGPPIVFFNGDFFVPDLVPYYYLVLWIFISTPVLNLILFTGGLYLTIIKFFNKLDFIKSDRNNYDFWKNENEKKDFFIILIFIILIFLGTFFNIKHYNSWRFFYFLNFFIIYFAIIFLNFYLKDSKINKKIKLILTSFGTLLLILNIYKIFLYHPYQSLYFNSLVTKKMKNNFEVDYTGLSAIHFLKDLSMDLKGTNDQIKVSVKSWYPIWRVHSLLNKKGREKIKIVFNNSEADILYSNRIYDVNILKNDKYEYENKFYKHKQFIIDDVIIYEIFKRKIE